MSNLEQIDQAYFTAWENGDYDIIRSLVSDDVDFIGPLAQTRGIEEFLTGLQGLGRVLTRIEVKARFANDTDVLTWFDLHSTIASPAPTAKWTHFENGKITRIRVAFDPREVIAAQQRNTTAS